MDNLGKLFLVLIIVQFTLIGCQSKKGEEPMSEVISENEMDLTHTEYELSVERMREQAKKEDKIIIDKTENFADRLEIYMPFENELLSRSNNFIYLRKIERKLNGEIFSDEYYNGIEKIHILDYCKGEIGESEYYIVVIEYYSPLNAVSEIELGYSRIALLYRDNRFIGKNTGIIRGSNTGGLLDDPYSGIEFTDNGFYINEYWGSSDRVSESYYFEVENDEVIQVSYMRKNHNTHNLYEATKDVYDFKEGTHKKYIDSYKNLSLVESDEIKKEKIDFEKAHGYLD